MVASRYAETKQEISDNIARVRSLVHSGQTEEAQALTAETEQLISGLPKNQQKKPREALRDASKPPVVVGELVPLWEHVKDRVDATAQHMAEGVRHHMEGARFAHQMAAEALQIRLRILDADGDPDVHCNTQHGRDAQSAMYALAGQRVSGDPEDIMEALDAFMNSVRQQMRNVLPEYVRGITKKDAQEFFPKALAAFPDEAPAEAIFKYYEEHKQAIARLTYREQQRIRRQIDKAKKADDLPKVLELEAQLGVTHDPEETASTTVAKLRKDLAAAGAIVETAKDLSPERRREIKENAEAAGEIAQSIVKALS